MRYLTKRGYLVLGVAIGLLGMLSSLECRAASCAVAESVGRGNDD